MALVESLLRSTKSGKTIWSKEKNHCCAYASQPMPGYFIRITRYQSSQAELATQCFELGISYKDKDTISNVVFCREDPSDARFETVEKLYNMVKATCETIFNPEVSRILDKLSTHFANQLRSDNANYNGCEGADHPPAPKPQQRKLPPFSGTGGSTG